MRLGPRNPTSFMSKAKMKSYIDDNNKAKSIVPSPAAYNKIVSWCKATNGPLEDHLMGKFLKEPRVTSTEAIYVNGKKYNTPAPSKYNREEAWRSTLSHIKGTAKGKEGKTTFIEQAKWLSS